MIRKLAVSLFMALACVGAWPTLTYAQSAIAGVVKDSSGAVLPGVSVEASSDALIEKVRAVVTDETGQYKIIDLRPGSYVVTFTLPGFNTFRRDGIDLGADFTAQVNAELRVGSLEETVTVTGASPIVDVQSTSRAQVLNRDLLDAVPAGRSYQGYAQLVPGISLSSPDVGGEASMQNTYMSVHGASSANVTMQLDGQMIERSAERRLGPELLQQHDERRDVVPDRRHRRRHLGRRRAREHDSADRRQQVRRRVLRRMGAGSVAERQPHAETDLAGARRSSLDHQAVGLQLLGGRPAQERQAVVLLLGASLGELRNGGRHVLLPGLRQVVRTQERSARHRRSVHPQRARPRHLADDVQDETECV